MRLSSLRVLAATVICTSAAVTATVAGRAAAPSHRSETRAMRGADVSWPNCPKGEGIPSRRSQGQPMPKPSARFVIVGLTNGPGFYPNPCLQRQLRWVARHDRLLGAYAMTTYPNRAQYRRYRGSGPYSTATHGGRLANVGYAEARFNVTRIRAAGMTVPMIWVDVEPYPVAPWSRRHRDNRAVVSGVIRGYRSSGLDVGIYTYARGWTAVVGHWRLPQFPTWVAGGGFGARRAVTVCGRGPSGGDAWLAQWSDEHRDYDVTCPGASSQRAAASFQAR